MHRPGHGPVAKVIQREDRAGDVLLRQGVSGEVVGHEDLAVGPFCEPRVTEVGKTREFREEAFPQDDRGVSDRSDSISGIASSPTNSNGPSQIAPRSLDRYKPGGEVKSAATRRASPGAVKSIGSARG